jgi:hypothetical protein
VTHRGSCWFRDNKNININININGGVEVPEGIENMSALHTLGTVNINTAGGTYFLAKLKDETKLPQLLKLSVCGINNKNWKDLRDALSAHEHLESLSLGLDEDIREDIFCFEAAPKALKSLRLYGHIEKLPAWTWLPKLKKFDLEVIISSQEDMNELIKCMPRGENLRRLCIKPTPQVRKLVFKGWCYGGGPGPKGGYPSVIKINCSSQLEVVIEQQSSIAFRVRVLIIHCSTKGSAFRYSGRMGRSDDGVVPPLGSLDTVWLKGYDEEAEYVADLKERFAAHPRKPIFKFEKLKSA